MMHKYFGGVVPETGPETAAETALRESTEQAIAAFGPAFDAMNFSDALKSLWELVAETDGYLTANAPWKRPADRSEADHTALQARVLATAAEAIRVITALVYPILPESAAKAWRQLGQGEIADAAKKSFLINLAWGGLKAGTKFDEPAPLFPRAEKDAVDRMQKIEEQNSKTVIEAAASGAANRVSAAKSAPATPAPAAETAEKRAIVNENSEKQASLNSAPVDSLGADSKAETKGYETLARAANASAVAAASAPAAPAAVPAAQTPAPAQVAEEPQYISIDDVIRVDLRVAQILVAERIPKADKLLRLEVDLGYEKRQIHRGQSGSAQDARPDLERHVVGRVSGRRFAGSGRLPGRCSSRSAPEVERQGQA
jgi:methionyl-tRNA synthetase